MRIWLVLVLAACSGGGKTPTPETPKRAAGPSCEAVADAMVNQLIADKDPRPPDTAVDPIRNLISKHCTADNWTFAAKQCLLTMKNAQDAEHCATLLTDEQQAALADEQGAGDPKKPKSDQATEPPATPDATPEPTP
jgi:hypothetical protein